MSRPVHRRTARRLSLGMALVATAACTRVTPEAERAAADSGAAVSGAAGAPAPAVAAPGTPAADSTASAQADTARAPGAPGAPTASAAPARARARAGDLPSAAPAPASGSRAELPDSTRAGGATRAPTNPDRLDSARRTPRLPVPSQPRDVTPSIPANPPRLEPLPPASPDAASSDAAVARLEREARALARTSGCSAAAGCRVAPLGARPCGGPRAYVAYCRATTDSARLFAKLAELERAERAANDRSGAVSICSLVTEPRAAYAGGRCTAAEAP